MEQRIVSPGRLSRHRRVMSVGIGVLAVAWGGPGLFGPAVSPARAADVEPDLQDIADRAHEQLLLGERFPSATTCAACHPKHYREWSVSQHAYAQMSPIFNAMHGRILQLTNGTNGDFCIRCHTPVGMILKEPEFMSNIDRHPTSREGVTCIVCHRVNKAYGKISGRLAIVEGDLTQTIYGPSGDNTALDDAIADVGLVTDPNRGGLQVHGRIDKFFQITTSAQCGTCHDVTLVNGFRLEEAFSEFKSSPASRKGISCQDCHMGMDPGRILAERSDPEFDRKNYDFGPAATVRGYDTPARKLTNHMFVGPDYSVLTPALFPLHRLIKEESEKDDVSADGYTIREWLRFKWKAGWGTDDFEDKVPDDYIDTAWDESDTDRPAQYRWQEPWDSPDDRYDAREVIQENLVLLKDMEQQRLRLLQNGYKLSDVVTERADPGGIRFRVQVSSGTDGHNVPTGFDAERLVWLFVQVMDADGTVVMQSGDLDPNGDLRDLHSLYVHNHELPLDSQLFSLQSRFVVRMVRGGEREQVLAVNYSPSPLPFLRPERRSSVLLGRPGGARKHKQGIEPNGHRWAQYSVKKKQMTGPGPYRAVIQLKAAMVPVNLINEIRRVGFDYNLSARDVAQVLVHGHVIDTGDEFQRVIWNPDSELPADNQVVGHQVLWEREVIFDVTGDE
ncbi:MAG: NapC/NirT family cytochrome c [Planctomycetes bacterium]|nr:NapC/NirT family cytochrome c [Planctomycetota bacterium]